MHPAFESIRAPFRARNHMRTATFEQNVIRYRRQVVCRAPAERTFS